MAQFRVRRRASNRDESLSLVAARGASLPGAASATGERFTLIRSRRSPRKQGTSETAVCTAGRKPSPLRQWLRRVFWWPARRRGRGEQAESVDAASFAGGGVSGRMRYLLDSALRHARDRTIVKLSLVLLIVYQVRMIVAAVAGAYDANSPAPVSFFLEILAAFLPGSARFGAVVTVLGRHRRWLDGVVRAVVPGVLGAIGELFVERFFGAPK